VLVIAAILISHLPHEWAGIDETVVERIAIKAGHPPRDPFIATDKGDILLFAFLIAGACGGFIAGYAFRHLFGVRCSSPKKGPTS
jgi:hypothetical protein